MNLKREYNRHQKEIQARLKEFSELASKEHIKELFFCILTPQSNAEKCWQAVGELKNCKLDEKNVKSCLMRKTRFHNNKTAYLIEANNKWPQVSKIINSDNSPVEMRKWIADNINGLGMKESSHFLRNIGKSNNQLAILDRHILRKMQELNLINEIKIKNNKDYLEKERVLANFSKQVNIPLDELDLLFWKIESGRIFK